MTKANLISIRQVRLKVIKIIFSIPNGITLGIDFFKGDSWPTFQLTLGITPHKCPT